MLSLSLALAIFVGTETPKASPPQSVAPRSIQTKLALGGRDVLELEIRSPRIETTELTRMLAQPELLDTLNEKHFASCGELVAQRPFLLAHEHFAAGRYAVGVAITANGALSLRLTQDGATTVVALENAESRQDPRWAVPQLSFAFLGASEVESFRLELRLGTFIATAPLDFSLPRIIVELNNTAHDLLSKSDRNARDVMKALYLAGRATKMTSDANPLILDTYAMALFHAGQVDAAVEAQRRALALLEPAQDDHRKGMTERLAAYDTARKN